MNSLRRTVTFGYYALATLIVVLSLFAFFELRLIGNKAIDGEHISEFFGITLEIRRFEKNYFLYHQAADIAENRAYVRRAQKALRENWIAFESFALPDKLVSLEAELRRYASLMDDYEASFDVRPKSAAALALEIRHAGKEIITIAETLANAERKFLRDSLDRHRQVLLGSIALLVLLAVAIGQFLSRRVTQPLKRLETGIEDIASGRKARLEIFSRHREVVSLTHAFNHVMSELELRQKRQLVRAEKLASLGTLLSEVAHELNNPLSNISTSCQILIEETGGNDPEFRHELLTQIDEQTLRARHIVRSLLDYARDNAFHWEPLPLAALFDETLRLVEGQMPSRVGVTIDVPAELRLFADKQRLQQAFINLIRNALEVLTDHGTLRITAHRGLDNSVPIGGDPHLITFGECAGHGEFVEIEIRDDGPGIPAEILPRIFDPFFTTKEAGKGSGLGLFIVFEVMEEHGGCIAVESVPRQGTAFFIRLPAGEESSPPRALKEPSS